MATSTLPQQTLTQISTQPASTAVVTYVLTSFFSWLDFEPFRSALNRFTVNAANEIPEVVKCQFAGNALIS
jgi:hypothetical protein